MKKISIKRKLNLNKEVVSRLNETQMDRAKGGQKTTIPGTFATNCDICSNPVICQGQATVSNVLNC